MKNKTTPLDVNQLLKKHKDILTLVMKAYNYGCVKINEWEKNFLSSIDRQIEDGRPLSWKQSKCLNSILERC